MGCGGWSCGIYCTMIGAMVVVWAADDHSTEHPAASSVYVDASARVSGDGSAVAPFRELEAAQQKARELRGRGASSVQVLIAARDYFNISLSFNASDSGVMWRSSSQTHRPILYGGARIDAWELWSGNIFRAALPHALIDDGKAVFNTLVEGQRSAILAREPDFGSGFLATASHSNDGFTWSAGALPASFDCNHSRCSVFTRAGYSSDIRAVLAVDHENRKCTISSNNTDQSRGSFYIQGALEFLSQPGEWAVSRGYLYYWPFQPEANISELVITAPTAQRMFSFVGASQQQQDLVHDVTLQGLQLVGSDIPDTYTYACKGTGAAASPFGAPCKAEGGPASPDETNASPIESSSGLIYTENATRITVENCSLRAAGVAAIWLQEASSYVTVRDNWIDGIAGFGIYVNGIAPNDTRYDCALAADVNFGHTISGNIIHDGGRQIEYGSGVWLYQSGNNSITHNVISRFPRDCVGFYGVLLFWTADPLGPVAPGAPPGKYRKYWGKYASYNGAENSYSTWDLLYNRNNYLAWNDLSNCNRQGLDGGVIESWGSSNNNTWEMNSVHDNEGYAGLSLFFADDFSPSLVIQKNIAFENNCPTMKGSNCAVFMMKSSNLTVQDNIVADSNYSRVFEIANYRMPASRMVATRNVLWNSTMRQLKRCGNQTTDCDSYYSLNTCQPDVFGQGLNFFNATLQDLLSFGDGSNNQRTLKRQYGFDAAQLAAPVVESADDNFVSSLDLLHMGVCSRFDQHSTLLPTRPFAPTKNPWYSRTVQDYLVPSDHSIVTHHKFRGSFNVSEIGVTSSFRFDRRAYKQWNARNLIQAERYDRTKNLWTTEATALGSSASHFNGDAPENVPPGSWARYDGIDFGSLSRPFRQANVSVRARVKSVAGGATIHFQLGSPEMDSDTSHLLASIAVPPAQSSTTSWVVLNSSTNRPLSNKTWPITATPRQRTVFMVFSAAQPTPAPAADDSPHRYWRITAGPSDFNSSLAGQLWDVCQIEFRARSDGKGLSLSHNATHAFASSAGENTPASAAFDGVANCTQWDGCAGCKSSMWRASQDDRDHQWVAYDFGDDPVSVRSVRLKQFPNQYCAATPSVQYSDDRITWVMKWRLQCASECPNNATASEDLGWTLSSNITGKNVAPEVPATVGEIGAMVDWFSFF